MSKLTVRFGATFLFGLLVLASVACSSAAPKASELDVSFLTAEQQQQWKQVQDNNPGLVEYVIRETNESFGWVDRAFYFRRVQKVISATEMSNPDKDILYGVIGRFAAKESGFVGELFSKEITDSALRETVLIQVVDTYAHSSLGRPDALRVMDAIQGKAARDAALQTLAR